MWSHVEHHFLLVKIRSCRIQIGISIKIRLAAVTSTKCKLVGRINLESRLKRSRAAKRQCYYLTSDTAQLLQNNGEGKETKSSLH
jgi:hypothetical protein